MQFGFPKKRQLRYQDFQRLRPAQKLGRAASFMKLAVKYAEACNAYHANFRYAAIVIGRANAYTFRLDKRSFL